jgi:hypothetical protein
MRHLYALVVPVFFALGLTLLAQSVPDTLTAQITETAATNSIKIAEDQVQRIGSLVEAGALLRIRLEQAQRDLADAQDEAILDRTLYGKIPVQSLTEAMGNDMVAAAQRRVDRQQQRINDANKLADDGIIARNSVSSLQDEMNLRTMALNLARSRSELIGELIVMARSEHNTIDSAAAGNVGFAGGMEHYEGSGLFNEAKQLKPLETAFTETFDKPLPISADGETGVHRALGFDHRGRVDVAINPEQKEGQWLMSYLKARKIPFYAFTHAIPGKATGAHIHIGPGSTRLMNAD